MQFYSQFMCTYGGTCIIDSLEVKKKLSFRINKMYSKNQC